MKVAIPYENGQVFQHFGHTEQFKIYEVDGGTVASAQVVTTEGAGHGALAGFLKAQGVEALICGGIGGGAQNAQAAAFASGQLQYDPNAVCREHDHHGEGHSCGHHEGGHSCHHS